MSDKANNLRSRRGGDIRRTELAAVIALLVAPISASVVIADSSKWDSSPTATGTTVQL